MAKIKLTTAEILPQDSRAMVSIRFVNRSSRPVLFWVTGVAPNVGIELEGDRSYTAQLPRDLTTCIVEVCKDGPMGEPLTWASLPKWNTPEDT